MLALLLLGGWLGAWSGARAATPVAADAELAYFIALEQAEEVDRDEHTDNAHADELSCRKLAEPDNISPADLLLGQMPDKDVCSREEPLWLALPPLAPVPGPQPELPQTERQPLLRPPALLG